MVDNKLKKEQDSEETIQRKSMIQFSRGRKDFARHGINQLNLDSTAITVGDYTQEDIRGFIEDYTSKDSQDSLMEVADILYVRSPHFRRLVHYFSDMATFSYAITPKDDVSAETSVDNVRQQYVDLAKFTKVMNISHEYRKIFLEIFKSEIFFGYVHYTEDDFYIQKMPREACSISSVEDGVFNYSIHMPTIETNIDTYKYTMPKEVIDLYNEWKKQQSSDSNSGSNSRGNARNNRGNRNSRSGSATETIQKEEESPTGEWVELGPENTICIKFDENNYNMNIPPFTGTFDAIFEIDGYKASRRNKETVDNYMMVFQRIPMRTDSENNNDFTIDYDSVTYFHGELSDNVPDSVGVITTPMELEPIEFAKDSVDTDNVSKAERDFWSASGTSQALFSTENNTTQGINMSINTDEQIVFVLLRQLERWTNRFVKHAFGETPFSVEILDVTYFNQEKFYKSMLEVSQYGVPVKHRIPSAMGIEPIQVIGMSFLENEVFKIHESWIPLQSSHTMSSKETSATGSSPEGEVSITEDTGGRPKEDIENVSDETLRKT